MGDMKKLSLLLFFALTLFFGSFTLTRLGLQKTADQIDIAHRKTFVPANYPVKNLPFTVVIIGYNNGGSVEKTLSSVLSQVYDNFRLIYIDDASDDGSFDLARSFLYDSEKLSEITIVQNTERLGPLANLERAVDTCEGNEIVVLLSDEECLAHEWVFQRLNAYYANPDLWISLSQGIDFPTFELNQRDNMDLQLKSFYAALFQKIHKSDLNLPCTKSLAFMIPMLEMAKDHFQFVDEVLLISSAKQVFSEEREEELFSENYLRSNDPYPSLEKLEVF